jgi:hypothetical protein
MRTSAMISNFLLAFWVAIGFFMTDQEISMADKASPETELRITSVR